MAKQICLINANCQGEALIPFLLASPGFYKYFEIQYTLNYKDPNKAQLSLDNYALFLHQYLDSKWGQKSTENISKDIPASCQSIIIPNMLFKGYWPFWTGHIKTIEFADILLEDLFNKGLPDSAILPLYIKLSENLLDSLNIKPDKIIRETFEIEKEKERQTPIKYTALIEELWDGEQLFLTPNHPGIKLIAHTAKEILKLLGLSPFPESFIDTYRHPQDDFWLPIHPVISKKLKLPFAPFQRRYPCFGRDMTFKEYIIHYLACRRNNIFDLTGILKSLSEDSKSCQ